MDMKRQAVVSALLVATAWMWASPASAQFGGLRDLGKKAIEKATEKKDEPPDSKPAEPESKPAEPAAPKADAAANTTSTTPAESGAPDYKAYQNYDFVPGDKIVFDDDFRSDMDGEFPAHWKLVEGQGVVNMMNGEPAFALTQGNYAIVIPRVTTASYLSDPFTVEFDFYPKAGGYEHMVVFLNAGDKRAQVTFGADVSSDYFDQSSANQTADYPGDHDAFMNKWHHAALVVKNGQLKAYEDQYRVLVVPDIGTFKPESVSFGGIADLNSPLLFKNVRIANGGSMTVIDRLAKEGRIVTHGILFDVNKSIVKPESMGTIRQIAAALQKDPALKLEIDGHTDSDGDAAKNLTLSQARADAVKQVLVGQGIDASRLTTKGFGATKPIDSNATPEGKANNRRVEFVKQ
jgi:OOP family OmpA-OmpF porin